MFSASRNSCGPSSGPCHLDSRSAGAHPFLRFRISARNQLGKGSRASGREPAFLTDTRLDLLSRRPDQARSVAALGPRAGVEAGEALTVQEVQVAWLARDGLSNPEIGVRLFISSCTVVQYHLGKVFTKLPQ
jgi:ATP/maltotriose-dependent transcriptional regulator MalT